MSTFPTKEKALGMYRKMYEIRKYEESIYYLFLEGIMPGTIHQSTGEEASAVGMLYDLRKEDWMASTHRPAGHDIAKGISVKAMMCEMFGAADGCCHGIGGAMHTGDISVGAMTANAIVGGNLPIAAGAALAFKMRGQDNVVVCFFGDGSTNQGTFHESLNLASIWKLPIVFVCENNHYGISMSQARHQAIKDVADRAAAYNMPGISVDGNDPLAVYEAAFEAVARARAGKGPTLIECKTYRQHGHFEGDPATYKPKEEQAAWIAKDPLPRFARFLIDNGVMSAEEVEAVDKKVAKEIEDAIGFAEAQPIPSPESSVVDVYSDIVEEVRER